MSTDLLENVLPDSEIAKNIAKNLTDRMAELGISQNALSRMTGDPVMTINGIVNGQHVPRSGVLARIAEALKTSMDALIQGTKKNSRRAS